MIGLEGVAESLVLPVRAIAECIDFSLTLVLVFSKVRICYGQHFVSQNGKVVSVDDVVLLSERLPAHGSFVRNLGLLVERSLLGCYDDNSVCAARTIYGCGRSVFQYRDRGYVARIYPKSVIRMTVFVVAFIIA